MCLNRSHFFTAVPLVVLLLGLTACPPQGTLNLPTDEDVERRTPDETAGILPGPLTGFLSSNRPRLIRDDVNEGSAILMATSDRASTFVWTVDDAGVRLLNLVFPPAEDDATSSMLRITGIKADPGPNGTMVTATVTITEVVPIDDETGEPLPGEPEVVTESIVLTLVRPLSELAVTLAAGAARITPEGNLIVTATVSGGEPFTAGDTPADGTCAVSDELGQEDDGSLRAVGVRGPTDAAPPYDICWTITELLDNRSGATPADNPGVGTKDALSLEVGDNGESLSGLQYRAPKDTGSVSFQARVTDKTGNRATATLQVPIESAQALTVVDGKPFSPEVAPRGTVEVSAKGAGGEGPYEIEFANLKFSEEQDPIGSLNNASCSGDANCTAGPSGCVGISEDVVCTMDFVALPIAAGDVQIRVTITDDVGAVTSQIITITVESPLELNISASSDVAGAQPNTSARIDTAVIGGTPPYTICYKVADAAGLPFGSLAAGDSNCAPIDLLDTLTDNCSCGLGDVEKQGKEVFGDNFRTFTAPARLGNAIIQVAVRDALGDLTTDLLTIPVSSLEIDPGGGGGGGGGGGAGPVSLIVVPSSLDVCFDSTATIDASISGGVAPYNYTFAIVEALLQDESVTPPAFNNDPGVSPVTATYKAHNDLATTTAVTHTVKVTVSEAGGSSANVLVPVTVASIPTADAGGASQEACRDDSSKAVGGGPPATGGIPPYTYEWTAVDTSDALVQLPDSVFSDKTDGNPNFDVQEARTMTGGAGDEFQLTLVVTDACGRTDSDDTTITILPELSVAAGAGPNMGHVCDQDPAGQLLSAAGVGGTPGYTFLWSGSGVSFLNDNSLAGPTFSAVDAPAGGYDLTVTVTDSKDCKSSETVTVIVDQLPSVSAGPPRNLCSDALEQIGGSPSASGGTPPFTFAWFEMGGAPGDPCPTYLSDCTAANPIFDASVIAPASFGDPDESRTVCVTATDTRGCTPLGMSACTTITVMAPCDDMTFCNGQETCVNGTCINGANPCPAVCVEVTMTCLECSMDSQCNDGDVCTTDSCVTGMCENTINPCSLVSDGCCLAGCNANNDADCLPFCGNGIVEAGEDCESGDCCDLLTCMFETAGTECRVSSGVCDPAESCTGASTACPSDAFILTCTDADGCCPAGCNAVNDDDCVAICGNAIVEPTEDCESGDCCVLATCLFETGGTECRASSSACDPAESCTGVGAACPSDVLILTCIDADGCCPAGCNALNDDDCVAICGNAIVEPTEDCESGDCCVLATCLFETGGTECRASTDACDPAESCTGSSAACPSDAIIFTCIDADGCCPAGCNANTDDDCVAVCGNGVVETGEECEFGACCDVSSCMFETAGTSCRMAAGDCDIAETCTGSSADCPGDALHPAGLECRPSAGVCDPAAEFCDGVSVDCPMDFLESAGTECRSSTDVCDPAESCDGASAACPADMLEGAGTECRASADVCDPAESCDGASAACPADMLEGAGTECRPSVDACDIAESCDGASVGCPADDMITMCIDADGCCPGGCTMGMDDDCP